MSTPEVASLPPPHHPWNIQFKPGEEKHLHSQLIRPLLAGLVEGGAVFCHLRQNKPFRHEGTFKFDLAGKRWSLRLGGYCSLRWVWRITVGFPAFPDAMTRQCELTVCIEEVTQEMGRGLAALLHTLAKDETPVWPMFHAWDSFPHYSWSKLCQSRYDDWRLWRDARRENLARQKPHTTPQG